MCRSTGCSPRAVDSSAASRGDQATQTDAPAVLLVVDEDEPLADELLADEVLEDDSEDFADEDSDDFEDEEDDSELDAVSEALEPDRESVR